METEYDTAKYKIKHWALRFQIVFEWEVFKKGDRKRFSLFAISFFKHGKSKALDTIKYGVDITILGCIFGTFLELDYSLCSK